MHNMHVAVVKKKKEEKGGKKSKNKQTNRKAYSMIFSNEGLIMRRLKMKNSHEKSKKK